MNQKYGNCVLFALCIVLCIYQTSQEAILLWGVVVACEQCIHTLCIASFYSCYIDMKLWQWVTQIEMCSNTSSAKQSLLEFCVGFIMPFVCWCFVKTVYYSALHFFSFARCGAVGKVVQELKYTFVLITDGGPDHNNTFLSVQLGLISHFLHHNLDMIQDESTAPYR